MVSGFGKRIKKKLIDLDRNQNWLMEQVRERTGGMFIDSAYLQKILSGERSPQKIVDSICEILEIDKEEEGNGG